MFNVKTITRIGVVAAITTILSMITVYQLPAGGSISLYLIPLIICSLNMKFAEGFFLAIVCATLQIIFGGFVLNPIQVILDYYLPLVLITSLPTLVKGNYKYLLVLVGFCIALLSYIISGMIFFETLFAASFAYNASFFIPTIIISLPVAYLVNKRVERLFD